MSPPEQRRTPKPQGPSRPASAAAPRCGLCGRRGKLVRTECCGQWICNDEANYVLFSYARNSCHRNHRRMTLCGYHHEARHTGKWQDCPKCRADFETEMYVWYGTNDYNFEKLANPPAYEPTRCAGCGVVIQLSAGGYSRGPKGYLCGKCMWKEMAAAKRTGGGRRLRTG